MAIVRGHNNLVPIVVDGDLTEDISIGLNNLAAVHIAGDCRANVSCGANNSGLFTLGGSNLGRIRFDANNLGQCLISGNPGDLIFGPNNLGAPELSGSPGPRPGEGEPNRPKFLDKSVGHNGTNEPEDVRKVYQRLVQLGFDWIGLDGDKPNSDFIEAIRLFQAIVNGRAGDPSTFDGLIEPGKRTEGWLLATNAPRWERLPDGAPESGFVFNPTDDGYERYGSSWLIEAIREGGREYVSSLGGTLGSEVPINVHELSLPRGGQTGHASSHFTGLNCDIRIPKKVTDTTISNTFHVGTEHTAANYDQEATRKVLKAFVQPKAVAKRLFNDPVLIAETFEGENLCAAATGHHNHIHVKALAEEQSSLRIVHRPVSRSLVAHIANGLQRLMDFEPITFEIGTHTLTADSKSTLLKAVPFLRETPPDINFEIGGHTDATTGTPAGNLQLSEDRAKAVNDFLTANGVSQAALTHRGFGSDRPLIRVETTDHHRSQNRRVTIESDFHYLVRPFQIAQAEDTVDPAQKTETFEVVEQGRATALRFAGDLRFGTGGSLPSGSQSVSTDESTLQESMRALLPVFAHGDTTGMASRLFEAFLSKKQGVEIWGDASLDRVVESHERFRSFSNRTLNAPSLAESNAMNERIHQLLKKHDWDINKVPLLTDLEAGAFNLGSKHFRTGDWGNGLAVMVNGVQHVLVFVEDYVHKKSVNKYDLVLRFVHFDVFGLDDDDVLEYGNGTVFGRLFSQVGNGITAWWQLQHQFNYAPLVTRIDVERAFLDVDAT